MLSSASSISALASSTASVVLFVCDAAATTSAASVLVSSPEMAVAPVAPLSAPLFAAPLLPGVAERETPSSVAGLFSQKTAFLT